MPEREDGTAVRWVLLPGLDGTGELYDAFSSALASEGEVVRVRFPEDEQLTYRELEATVHAACQAGGPCILVAESFSTPLAIRYASSAPENLAGLILCNGFACSPVPSWLQSCTRLLAPLLFRFELPSFAIRTWLVGPSAPAPLVQHVRSVVGKVKPTVLTARLNEILDADVREHLRKMNTPFLYLRGTGDRLVRDGALTELMRIRPDMQIARLYGPHLLLQREPKAAAAVAQSFAQDVRAG